jgi:hypothetical protein
LPRTDREREKKVGKVGTGFSTSLDGFIAKPNGDVGPLFDWYFAGDTEHTSVWAGPMWRSSASRPA